MLSFHPQFHVFTTATLTANGRHPQRQHTFALLEPVLFLRLNKSPWLQLKFHTVTIKCYICSRHDNWFSLGCMYSWQTITQKLGWVGLRITTNLPYLSWFFCRLRKLWHWNGFWRTHAHDLFFTAAISWQTLLTQNPTQVGRSFLLGNYSHTCPTWFPKSHLPKRNIY